MCFLFSDDEFSATALLSESARIKNTYTDGTKFHKGEPIHSICREPTHKTKYTRTQININDINTPKPKYKYMYGRTK